MIYLRKLPKKVCMEYWNCYIKAMIHKYLYFKLDLIYRYLIKSKIRFYYWIIITLL